MNRRSMISMRSLPLWASAFVLAGILLAVAGRLPENPAYAGMATTGTGGFTLVTDRSGFGPDTRPYEILYVLDNTTQTLARIRREIVANGSLSTNAHNVKIIVENGQVLLRGPVNSPTEKKWIGETAGKIASNLTVVNELEVLPG